MQSLHQDLFIESKGETRNPVSSNDAPIVVDSQQQSRPAFVGRNRSNTLLLRG